MKMMIKIDKNLLNQWGKRHEKYLTENLLHDSFVDFRRLDLTKVSKDAKALLYRPQKMKVLYDGYQRLSVLVRSNAMRKHERREEIQMDRIRRMNWEPRRWEKTEEEVERGKKLWHSIDKWIKEGKAK